MPFLYRETSCTLPGPASGDIVRGYMSAHTALANIISLSSLRTSFTTPFIESFPAQAQERLKQLHETRSRYTSGSVITKLNGHARFTAVMPVIHTLE